MTTDELWSMEKAWCFHYAKTNREPTGITMSPSFAVSYAKYADSSLKGVQHLLNPNMDSRIEPPSETFEILAFFRRKAYHFKGLPIEVVDAQSEDFCFVMPLE